MANKFIEMIHNEILHSTASKNKITSYNSTLEIVINQLKKQNQVVCRKVI